MYTLYYSAGACSLATQVILRELGQSFKLVNKNSINNFDCINPVQTVPVLMVSENSSETVLTEGVAILLYLLEKHPNRFIPEVNRQIILENMLFANATMHPAYGRLFFIKNHVETTLQQPILEKAADEINKLWSVVEKRLGENTFLGGDTMSVADILLAVYSRWGQFFPVDIRMGAKTREMIQKVIEHPNFQASLAAESQVAQET